MTSAGSRPGLEGKRPTAKGNRTRQRIIDSATELFAERGYHSTSLSDISDHANVQRGALYYHIAAKEELLFEVLRQHVEFVLEHVRQIAALPLDPRSKVRQLVAFQVEALLDRQRDVTIYERESHHLTGDRRREFLGLQDAVEDVWQQVVDEGIQAGVLRPIDRVVVKSLFGLLESPYRWYRGGRRLSSREIADYLADLVLFGIVAAPPR